VKHNYDVLTGLLYGMYSYYVHWSAEAGSEAWARSLKAYRDCTCRSEEVNDNTLLVGGK